MQIYQARLGNSPHAGLASDTWLVRAKSFTEAARKATTTAEKKAKDFTHRVWLISLQYMGDEA